MHVYRSQIMCTYIGMFVGKTMNKWEGDEYDIDYGCRA